MSRGQERREYDEWDQIQQQTTHRIMQRMAGRMYPGRSAVVKIMRKRYSKYGKNRDLGRILSFLCLPEAEAEQTEEETERI